MRKSIFILAIISSSILYAGTTQEELQVCQTKLKQANERILELLDKKIKGLENGITDTSGSASVKTKDDIERNAKEEYFKKIKISEVKAKFYDSLIDGKIPGITFKLKNTGDKTLSLVEVTVYFLDKDGNPIHEEQYYPVNSEASFRPTTPLKPNYIWRIERGKFYQAKSVPKEWKKGKVKVEITDVNFAK